MGMDSFDATTSQPSPIGDGQDVNALVVHDLIQRSLAGEKKYGARLKTHNGRNPLIDAYQEALDLAVISPASDCGTEIVRFPYKTLDRLPVIC
jgi:hypothetical protein